MLRQVTFLSYIKGRGSEQHMRWGTLWACYPRVKFRNMSYVRCLEALNNQKETRPAVKERNLDPVCTQVGALKGP